MTHRLPFCFALALGALAALPASGARAQEDATAVPEGTPSGAPAQDGAVPIRDVETSETPIVVEVVGEPAGAGAVGTPTADQLARQRVRYKSMRVAGALMLFVSLVGPPVVFAGLSAAENCDAAEGDEFCGLGPALGTLGAAGLAIPLLVTGGILLARGLRRGRALELRYPRVAASPHGALLSFGGRF